MNQRALAITLALAGCGTHTPGGEIVGPYTGTTYRFAVVGLTLPTTKVKFAADLNGDGKLDNQLGNVVGALATDNDVVTAAAIDDLLGSGALAPVVEITTDDPSLRNDPTVGVRFVGRDGEASDTMGASLVNGHLATNPAAATRHPAHGFVHLPLFEHADPLTLDSIGLQMELDATSEGFDGALHGAWLYPGYVSVAAAGFQQMVSANPTEFPLFPSLFDANHDGIISADEFSNESIIKNVISPDVQLTDGNGNWAPNPANTKKDALSFGVGLKLVQCPNGNCHAPPVNHCDDRAADGDETDVDCGGSCLPCAGGLHCKATSDCQSTQCQSGVCNAPNCADGAHDGFETDVDCGWNCGPCANGRKCTGDADCAQRDCVGTAILSADTGTCMAPMCSDGVLDAGESDVDCGHACPPCASGKNCASNADCASGTCDFTGFIGVCQ